MLSFDCMNGGFNTHFDLLIDPPHHQASVCSVTFDHLRFTQTSLQPKFLVTRVAAMNNVVGQRAVITSFALFFAALYIPPMRNPKRYSLIQWTAGSVENREIRD